MVYVQPAVSATADGGEVASYSLPDGTSLVTATPPANFDPTTASSRTLAEYGFPSEPTDVSQQADWLAAMKAYRSDPPPTGVLPVDTSSQAIRYATRYVIWGGWTAGDWSGTSNTYIAAKGVQTVPNPTNNCTYNNNVAFWVGLGGTSTANNALVQQGFECGNSNLGSGTAFRPWTEFVPGHDPLNFCGYANWTLPAGDVIYQNESFETSTHTAYFYLEDETTGTTHSCSQTKPAGWTFIGNTADWEAEAPNNISVNFGSVPFSDSNAELNSSGSWVTLGSQTTNKEILGVDSSDYCIAPGAIGGDNQSFTDSYHQADCS
jgi:hypothetical protein